MQGTTRVWWETWWPMPQCSAPQPLWWCGGTVGILSSPLLPPGYLAHWTDILSEGRASLGDKSLVLSVTLFLLLLSSEFLFHPKASEQHRVMYARNPLYLQEGTYLHNQKCSLQWQKYIQANAAKSLPHKLKLIRIIYVYHFIFELRQICNPNSSIR